jgi:hypothetical protein
VLTALHDIDAIRLAPDGQIAVSYPFSATPTRHRVRIGAPGNNVVDVDAMCAIDALGISASRHLGISASRQWSAGTP